VNNYKVTNPATNEVEREYLTATDAQIQSALGRSAKAFGTWQRSAVEERSKALHRAADLYEERVEELALIVSREMGKLIREGAAEVGIVASILRYYADEGPALIADSPLTPSIGGTALVRKAPIGPLLGIMPWNLPYYQVARFAAPNLMVGNTILLKHTSQCPESALAMEQIFRDAGFPEDVYINVFATSDQIAGMVADQRLAGVSVTGSERAGAAVAEVAGRNLKKVVLELGGSDPFIVLDGENMDQTVSAAVVGRTVNAGQICNAAKRFIVIDEAYDEFVDKFTAAMAALRLGDPTDASTDLGPLASERAAQDLISQIDDAVGKGARVRTGGKRVDRPGAFVEPTVLSDVTSDMRAYHEELFGPAAVVYRVENEDAAVELANGSDFGLGGAVFSADTDRALRVADRLDTGMVWINSAQGSAADLPFGGTKRSGFGRELGSYGITEFVNMKLIYTA
jgi:succinate-semialdehyde dehydrogenase/glutarate-semialdehyde dehydrogenase